VCCSSQFVFSSPDCFFFSHFLYQNPPKQFGPQGILGRFVASSAWVFIVFLFISPSFVHIDFAVSFFY